jgi:hypothetical protein
VTGGFFLASTGRCPVVPRSVWTTSGRVETAAILQRQTVEEAQKNHAKTVQVVVGDISNCGVVNQLLHPTKSYFVLDLIRSRSAGSPPGVLFARDGTVERIAS